MSKRQETPIKKNAFVHKLYSMLNDPELSNLIWWTRDEDSNTFALSPGKDFAKALTRYFKHGNVASFVRQLHMYGFHKVSDPSHANVTSTSADAELPVWEFKHSSGKFKKNDESSLVYIKRRSSSNNSRNVYNNENDANVVIPTSTPSPEHAQFIQEGGHPYLPQGYYFYNGHQVTHHMSPHMQFPSGGVPAPQHQSKHPQMYYTQKPMPSSIPQAYSQENVLEKPKMADIQRSISPQSQPSSQHQVPQVLKPHSVTHISQPPISLVQLPPSLQDATKPSHPQPDAHDSQQPQHYTPNLQFRKIWENDNLHSRPRNPSLLFDPLAPVPVTSQLQPLHQSNVEQQPQSSFSYLLSRSDSRSSYASARESITSTRDSFVSNRDSIASGRESLASAKDSISSTKDSFRSARDSYGNSRDSFTFLKDPDNKLSIKLPPPSSIQNPSFYSNNSNSPFSMASDTNSYASTVTSSNLPKAPSSESPSSSTSTIKIKSNSIPETSTTAKRPSIFPSHSVHEKLRPSLIELHFGSSSKASILNPQHDSIGSQSSHNSIFSNNSSLSSTSSFHRTSSFGSISHHPIFANKNSISIAPHEVLPTTLSRSKAEQEVSSDTKDSTPPLKTSKVLQMISPIKRSSTTAIPTTNGVPIALKIRSLNSSPLSRLLTNEELITADVSNPKSSNTKVSIHSLLDDDQADEKFLLPSKSNIKAGLGEVKEVIAELNEEKDTNEETEMKDIQSHFNGNDDSQNHDDNPHSKSLADLKRQKLD